MSDNVIVVAHVHPFTPSDRIIRNYDAGVTIADIKRDLSIIHKTFVVVNGELAEDDAYATKPGDHVAIKAVPGGEGASQAVGRVSNFVGNVLQYTPATIAIVAGLLLAPFTGGASLIVTGFGIAMLATTPAGQEFVEDLFSPNPAKPNTQYGINGASNATNKWGKVPIVFGKHMVVPPLAAKPWTQMSTTTTDGDTQKITMLYCVGAGKLRLSNLKFGDTMLSPNTAMVRNGSVAAGDIVNFSGVDIQIYDNGTSPSLYHNTVIEEQVGVIAKYGNETVRTTAKNIDKFSVDISFPSGLYAYNDSGTKINRAVNIEARYRVAGSGTAWASMTLMPYFSGAANTITKSNTEVLRYQSTVTGLTPATDTAYEVIVKRLNTDMVETDSGADTIRWDVLRSERTGERPVLASSAAKMTFVAVRVQANKSLSGTVDRFSCIAEPEYDVYDGSGTGAAEWTDGFSSNPAVAYLAALRAPINPRPVADADIDWPRLEAWYASCNTAGWTCNAVVGNGERLFDLLSKITDTGRARPLIRDGKYSVVVDEAKTTIVQHFTPRNSRGFTWSKKFPDLPHALRLSFVSADDDYEATDRIVCDDGYTESTATEFQKGSLWGITSPSLVWKHGRYQIAVQKLRPEVYTFEASAESIVCEPGDLIVCTHDVPMFGLFSARIKTVTLNGSNQATAITIDDVVTMEGGKTYAVRYRRAVDNTSGLATVNTVAGDNTTLTFATPIAASVVPAADDLILFGESGTESVRLLVAGVEPGNDFETRIIAVDEAPGVHTADSGTIPDWDAHISKPAPFSPTTAIDNGTSDPVSKPQPRTFPSTKALSTLSDTVDYNGQYGVYNGLRYIGTMPTTWTRDDAGQTAVEVEAYMEAAKDYADGLASTLQTQIDRAIIFYTQAGDPSYGWTTEQKKEHIGDYWRTASGQLWSQWNGSAWTVISDPVAQAAATNAQNTADDKSTLWPTLSEAQTGGVANDLFIDASLLYRATVDGASISIANSIRLTPKRYADVANASARGALTGMIFGDSVYQVDTRQWYVYTTSWIANGEPQLIPNDINTYAPRYLGKFTTDPSPAHAGDWYLKNAATYGIYSYTTSWARETTPSTEHIAAAWPDIMTAVNAGEGAVTDYCGSGVNFIDVLGANVAFINKLFAQDIVLGATGYIKSNNYAESGGYATAGVKIDAATGEVISKSAKFVDAILKSCTVASVTAGTNVVKCITGSYPKKEDSADYHLASIQDVDSVSGYFGQKLQLIASGTVRVSFTLTSSDASTTAYGKIYKQSFGSTTWVAVGTERSTMTSATYTEDISVTAGDVFGIFTKIADNSKYSSISNFKLLIAETPGILSGLGI